MIKTQTYIVEEQRRKLRLDQFLFDEIGTLSRMFINGLLANNSVLVNETAQPGGYHLQKGDLVKATFDERAETAMTPEDLPLEVLFEDAEILIVNKPALMLMHPTSRIKTGTLANALAFHLNFKTPTWAENLPIADCESKPANRFIRPGLVHRLDKETSGLLVVAKTTRAHSILSKHFERKLIEKRYLAIVKGLVADDAGEIRAPVGRVEEKPHWRVMDAGKSAHTRFKVLERRGATTLLELEPVTGRTNQLRVHCAHVGHPVVGDLNYGGGEFSRLCLHAARLAFFHPNGGWLKFETTPPPEFQTAT